MEHIGLGLWAVRYTNGSLSLKYNTITVVQWNQHWENAHVTWNQYQRPLDSRKATTREDEIQKSFFLYSQKLGTLESFRNVNTVTFIQED